MKHYLIGRCVSLLSRKNSLFCCVGNLPKNWHYISSLHDGGWPESARFREIPCFFPDKQGKCRPEPERRVRCRLSAPPVFLGFCESVEFEQIGNTADLQTFCKHASSVAALLSRFGAPAARERDLNEPYSRSTCCVPAKPRYSRL